MTYYIIENIVKYAKIARKGRTMYLEHNIKNPLSLITPEQIVEIFQNIRRYQDLIHMIPNTVSASLCADGLAAIGARPLMAVASEEMEEIAEQANACVINLGQLNQDKILAAKLAIKYNNKLNKPLVIDPVGCGASSFRLQALQELLSTPWQGILKGNYSEIYSIQYGQLTKEGVDSLKKRQILKSAQLSHNIYLDILQGTYFITGETDCILWEDKKLEISHKKMRNINLVGSGCLTGAITGACYSAVSREKNYSLPKQVVAAIATSVGMAFALEYIEGKKGYGTAKIALLDTLGKLSEEVFLEWLKERVK